MKKLWGSWSDSETSFIHDGIPKESGVCINGGLIKDIPDMPKMWEKIDFALAILIIHPNMSLQCEYLFVW